MYYRNVEIVTHRGMDCEATAEAPAGKVFKEVGVHEVVCGLIGSDLETLKRCVANVKRDIDGGFEDCADSECEWCNS